MTDSPGGRWPRRRLGAGFVAIALGVSIGVAACSSQTASSPSTAANPAASNGQAVYAARCASCHGSDLRGTDRGPSHLSKVYEPGHHSDESFRAAIARGARQHHWTFGDMPPVDGVSPAEVAAVIAYIRTVQTQSGFEPYPPR